MSALRTRDQRGPIQYINDEATPINTASVRALTQRIVLLATTLPTSLAWAQSREPTPEDTAALCAGCGALGGTMILIPIVFFALNIALLVWVARDAKSRGMDSAVLWMILVMFTSVIGLVIYLFARPKGEVVPCIHCKNMRLEASAKCPHCDNA